MSPARLMRGTIWSLPQYLQRRLHLSVSSKFRSTGKLRASLARLCLSLVLPLNSLLAIRFLASERSGPLTNRRLATLETKSGGFI